MKLMDFLNSQKDWTTNNTPNEVKDRFLKHVKAQDHLGPIAFLTLFEIESHLSKKNNRPVYGNRIGKSARLIKAEKYLRSFFDIFKERQQIKAPIRDYMHLLCVHYYHINDFCGKNRTIKLTLPDDSNLIELPQDCLQEAGIIHNDSFIRNRDGSGLGVYGEFKNWTNTTKDKVSNPYYLGVCLRLHVPDYIKEYTVNGTIKERIWDDAEENEE